MSFIEAVKAHYGEPTPPRAPVALVETGDLTAYVSRALDAEIQAVATATEGTRNHRLFVAARNLGELVHAGITEQQIRTHLTDAARTCGLDDHEIDGTITSGLTKGLETPRGPKTPLNGHPVPEVTTIEGEQTDLTPEEQADLAELQFEQAVARELYQQRARREAKKRLDAQEALRSFREPPSLPTLTEELDIPDEPVAYRIADLFPAGGNVLLTAQYKAGKTTLIDQVAKAVADQTPFLGRFAVDDPGGRIALWNYEIDARQYRRWLRDVDIQNTNRVTILNLRGYRMPVTVPYVEDWIVRWLEEREVRVWVVDPFARAFVGAGKSENDNTEVGAFLDTLDVIKNRAGVSELILPTHTGRAEMEQGEERARGATRLDDWADVRWLLTKDDDDVRYFRATGRDVDVLEEKLDFDPVTRALHFGGGDRSWEKRRRLEDAVVSSCRETPGVSLRALRTAVRSLVKGTSNDSIDDAISAAERHHRVRIEKAPNGSATQHYALDVTTIGASE